MKTIKDYINESLRKTDIDDFENIAYSAIDYVYNEGVISYDDEHLNDYVNGSEEPNYKEVIDIVMSEFKNIIPAKILPEIKKYPKTSYKEDFELAILHAMDRIFTSK